jgi:hypothetical protein
LKWADDRQKLAGEAQGKADTLMADAKAKLAAANKVVADAMKVFKSAGCDGGAFTEGQSSWRGSPTGTFYKAGLKKLPGCTNTVGAKEVLEAQRAASAARYLADEAQHAAQLAGLGPAAAGGAKLRGPWDKRVAEQDKEAKSALKARQERAAAAQKQVMDIFAQTPEGKMFEATFGDRGPPKPKAETVNDTKAKPKTGPSAKAQAVRLAYIRDTKAAITALRGVADPFNENVPHPQIAHTRHAAADPFNGNVADPFNGNEGLSAYSAAYTEGGVRNRWEADDRAAGPTGVVEAQEGARVAALATGDARKLTSATRGVCVCVCVCVCVFVCVFVCVCVCVCVYMRARALSHHTPFRHTVEQTHGQHGPSSRRHPAMG